MAVLITRSVTVFMEYMMPGPSTIRTAPRSLVARDMISPVLRDWRKERDIFCTWARKSLRRSYSTWRLTPIRILRIQKRKNPSTREIATMSRA